MDGFLSTLTLGDVGFHIFLGLRVSGVGGLVSKCAIVNINDLL